MKTLSFTSSNPLTIGVELELQIIDRNSYNLTNEIDKILDRAISTKSQWCLKPELTNNNLEINSSVHSSIDTLEKELLEIRDFLKSTLKDTHLAICGGGTHPFQDWKNSEIHSSAHYKKIQELYGYLAQQDTIFGLHIHIGCESGDQAIYLTQMFSTYIPHLIALSGSSPFIREIDTLFVSSRLNNTNFFPTGGVIPLCKNWHEFSNYYNKLRAHNIISSIHDIYWDIRPQSTLGTVEVRICDMPLSIKKIIEIVIFTRALATFIIDNKKIIKDNIYQYYTYNRFQSMRYGYDAQYIDPFTEKHFSLHDHFSLTMDSLNSYWNTTLPSIFSLKKNIQYKNNDSKYIRDNYYKTQSFKDLVKNLISQWEK